MKRVNGIFPHIVATPNLFLAAKRALRKKYRSVHCARYYFDSEPELFKLQEELILGAYHPREYRVFTIFEPKERVICCSHVRDRVVHHAIFAQLEPSFERRFIFDSYACRKGKGVRAALSRCQYFAGRYPYFLKLDIRKHFETIDHRVLKNILGRMFKDKSLHSLLNTIIDHSVPQYAAGKGLPIGNLTSQFFANLYLDQLDHFVKEELRVAGYLRYMDDFLLYGNDKTSLWNSYARIREFLEKRLLLALRDDATKVAPVREGIPFLGFRVFARLIRLQRSRLVRVSRKVRLFERLYIEGCLDEDALVKAVNGVISHAAQGNTRAFRQGVLVSSVMA